MELVTKPIVLDVGNCGPDHASISRMLTSNFDVEVLQAHGHDDTLEILRSQPVRLVLINRKLDQDYTDGTEILKKIKADAALSQTPVMLVTNHAEHQQAAVAMGATHGFGKLALNAPETLQRISAILS